MASKISNQELLRPVDTFAHRHLGPRASDIPGMLAVTGFKSLDELIDHAVPDPIQMDGTLNLTPALSESEILRDIRDLADQNKVFRSFIGMGYHDTHTPPVILRNIMENPGWYTQYTPYQAEIAQGRLEALLNFQTLITDLTGLEIANASMLDEGTAAAEAMTLAHRAKPRKSTANLFFISEKCHPQTIATLEGRADPLGIEIVIGDHETYDFATPTFGALLQYPTTDGDVHDYSGFCARAHEADALVIVAADLLALTLLTPPGEFGADVAVGNSQRFGVPMGFGGPHAAFMATSEKYKRMLPGRLVGVSKDSEGRPALRLALQTREQHIRRERATSNICTAQVLLAVMASMYAVYHGPDGLVQIAKRIKLYTEILKSALKELGWKVNTAETFDTLMVYREDVDLEEIHRTAQSHHMNLRRCDPAVGIALDETVTRNDLETLLKIFGAQDGRFNIESLAGQVELTFPGALDRSTAFLTHPVFNSYHSETEMLRYIYKLQSRDLSLAFSMIPLGSCTMKLNATSEMIPVTWPEWGKLHPFAPLDQAKGYLEMFRRLESDLAEITGFSAVSLQPNAGSQGEYSGLLTIRAYHHARGDTHRNVCLIPASAHGTNPASAVMAGMRVIVVATDENGNIDVADLQKKADANRENLAALMVTYPSTHGVFETAIREICEIIHNNGGQVYLDGANMNALVGLSQPGKWGADVCHLNLHKTFCIPHGGGGPGMGPICVAEHLAPYLPGHPEVEAVGGSHAIKPVSAAPWGSPSILLISYAYIRMMGAKGLEDATKYAILNANYVAQRLEPYFPVLYKGETGMVGHECIVELRHLKSFATVDDVVKRLMDYGFHAPTMSFPVPGTLMIEPTESESLEELDRFCEAMIAIRREIQDIEDEKITHQESPLASAPHTAGMITGKWDKAYSREVAAFPAPWVKESKFWPFVGRIDNVYGDRNLFCVCIPIEEYEDEQEVLALKPDPA